MAVSDEDIDTALDVAGGVLEAGRELADTLDAPDEVGQAAEITEAALETAEDILEIVRDPESLGADVARGMDAVAGLAGALPEPVGPIAEAATTMVAGLTRAIDHLVHPDAPTAASGGRSDQAGGTAAGGSAPTTSSGAASTGGVRRGAADAPTFHLDIDGLDAGVLVPVRFSLDERMGHLFRLTLTAIHRQDPTKPDPLVHDLVGRELLFRIGEDDGPQRHLPGLLCSVTMAGERRGWRVYELDIVPPLWTASQVARCRVFQAMATHEIVRCVLEEAGLDPQALVISLDRTSPPRDHCVQLHETDLAFVARLMEEEGLYSFTAWRKDDDYALDGEGALCLVVTDHPMIHGPLPEGDSVPFQADQGAGGAEAAIRSLTLSRSLRPNVARSRARDFRRPAEPKTEATGPSDPTAPLAIEDALRLDASPGAYVTRKVETSGDAVPADRAGLGLDPADPKDELDDQLQTDLARVAVEAARADGTVLKGSADLHHLRPGFLFTVQGHPDTRLDGELLLVSVHHEGSQAPADAPEWADDAVGHYRNTFTAVPGKTPWRLPVTTPRPRIDGAVTALVTGPEEGGLHVDRLGRIKLRFPFVEDGLTDERSSCWARVAQAWAGKGWGIAAWPRVGQEVVVQFEHGDPDRPLVVGSLYDGAHDTPDALPDHASRFVIRSRSTGGRAGHNELRFEDEGGREQLYLHAQRAMDVAVGASASRTVGSDDTTTVHGDQEVTVAQSVTSTIGQSRTDTVGANDTLTVGATRTVNADHIRLEAGTKIELVVGRSSLVITSDSIVLQSKDIVVHGTGTVDVDAPDVHAGRGQNGLRAKGAEVKVKGMDVKITSLGSASLEGLDVTIEGTSKVAVKSATIQHN